MLTIRLDARPMVRRLDDIAKRQLPFATARALTETAQVAKITLTKQLPSVFDRPTPFTRNAVAIQAARKSALTARVFVKDRQTAYLGIQETGGTRQPKKRALVLPTDIRRDRFGNMPRGELRRLMARKDTFSGKVGGVAGVWKRPAKAKAGAEQATKPTLLVTYEPAAKYRPRFGFKDRTAKVVRGVLPVAFRQSLAKALASARS